MNKWTFIITLLFCNHAFSADNSCSTVNLTSNNQIFNGIPTYDQGGGQICFAYTAAQIIEGQRVMGGHKYNKDKAINPLSIALSLAIKSGQTDLQQGGVACAAVNHARKNPVCPVSKSFKTAAEIEGHIDEFKECSKNPESQKCKTLATKFNCNPKVFGQNNALIYVKAIEDSKCPDSEKIRLNIPECVYTNDESKPNTHFKKLVDNVFNSKKPRPVEIGYSMNLLTYSGIEKGSYKVARKIEENVVDFSLRYKPHSSILLGRRMNKNGKCQYLLRNTQGKDFCPSGIASRMGWECDKKSEGIWINEKELFESTFQISNVSENPKVEDSIDEFLNLNATPPSTMCHPII